ncbi:restriction endonuclease subunit S [Paenibacillus brasilensis]|uniref:Type I restriction enzyme S subunit n=1 Tax=Paenibacillus brasilensis TaxID=128574 RepID=A0ABU0L6N2_9BACL|nr:restriction endonuclease subunit S [Paenibacillus brasilensis]MDQ0496953.1 type I restriction enzyme S subunit [Paenibacillus brasilensis]
MIFTKWIQINPKISLEKGKEYPFVEMANVGIYTRSPKKIDFKPYSSGVKFQKGDTVIARIEPCLQNGKGFFANELPHGFGSTEFLVFRPKTEDVDNRFLYYYMQIDYMRKNMIASMTGATGRQRVNNGIFDSLEISIPNITIQRRIVDILSAYDDLIENNQKQIKLLEEAAMQLYKEWFVKLHFPGYEKTKFIDGVPEGWKHCTLQDVVEFDPIIKLIKGKTKKSVPMAALSTSSLVVDESLIVETESNSGSKFQYGDTLLARITPCLENGKTAFVDFLDEDESAVGSTEYIVMRSKALNPYMVYCIARNDDFRQLAINSMSGADGRQRVKVDVLRKVEYLLPPEHLIKYCFKHMKPLFEKIRLLNKQSHLLRQTRDKLLPRLMSGELEV